MSTWSNSPALDRQLLLAGAERNAILDLTEVQRYGTESWGDPDYVCIYGLRPREWYGRGIRILGRTAVECTRDELADNIGRDIAAVAKSAPLHIRGVSNRPFPWLGQHSLLDAPPPTWCAWAGIGAKFHRVPAYVWDLPQRSICRSRYLTATIGRGCPI